MSTLAEKLRQRKIATASTPVVAPEPVVQPVVEEPVVVPEPVVATVIPPDAPGGDLVPERAEGVEPKGLMATLAARRTTKNKVESKPNPVAETRKWQHSPETVVDIAKEVIDTMVVTPPAEVEYVEAVAEVAPEVAAVVESAHEAWVKAGRPGPDPDVVKAAETIRNKWIEEGSKRPLSLYIDCYPEKAEFDTLRALEDEIAARTPSLLEHLRKTSPKDVPEGTVDLGEVLFGRGYSTLAASFALKPISGPYTVSTLGPASSKVLEVLLPKATFVVRGRR